MQLLWTLGKEEDDGCSPHLAGLCRQCKWKGGSTVIEIANDNGEFVPWEFADADIKVDIEWAIFNGEKPIVID